MAPLISVSIRFTIVDISCIFRHLSSDLYLELTDKVIEQLILGGYDTKVYTFSGAGIPSQIELFCGIEFRPKLTLSPDYTGNC